MLGLRVKEAIFEPSHRRRMWRPIDATDHVKDGARQISSVTVEATPSRARGAPHPPWACRPLPGRGSRHRGPPTASKSQALIIFPRPRQGIVNPFLAQSLHAPASLATNSLLLRSLSRCLCSRSLGIEQGGIEHRWILANRELILVWPAMFPLL